MGLRCQITRQCQFNLYQHFRLTRTISLTIRSVPCELGRSHAHIREKIGRHFTGILRKPSRTIVHMFMNRGTCRRSFMSISPSARHRLKTVLTMHLLHTVSKCGCKDAEDRSTRSRKGKTSTLCTLGPQHGPQQHQQEIVNITHPTLMPDLATALTALRDFICDFV